MRHSQHTRALQIREEPTQADVQGPLHEGGLESQLAHAEACLISGQLLAAAAQLQKAVQVALHPALLILVDSDLGIIQSVLVSCLSQLQRAQQLQKAVHVALTLESLVMLGRGSDSIQRCLNLPSRLGLQVELRMGRSVISQVA